MTTADTVEYVSDLDPGKTYSKVPLDPAAPEGPTKSVEVIAEGATRFKLRSLDVFLMGYIYDNASSLTGKQGSDEVGIHTRINQTNIEAVRFGLVDFVGFGDGTGTNVKMKTVKAVVNGRTYDAVSDAIMSMLGIRLIQELASKIKTISEVSPSEEKNSAGV